MVSLSQDKKQLLELVMCSIKSTNLTTNAIRTLDTMSSWLFPNWSELKTHAPNYFKELAQMQLDEKAETRVNTERQTGQFSVDSSTCEDVGTEQVLLLAAELDKYANKQTGALVIDDSALMQFEFEQARSKPAKQVINHSRQVANPESALTKQKKRRRIRASEL